LKELKKFAKDKVSLYIMEIYFLSIDDLESLESLECDIRTCGHTNLMHRVWII